MTEKPTHKKPKGNDSGRRLAPLEMMRELTSLARGQDDPCQIAAGILGSLRSWVGCDAATLFVINESTAQLEEAASIGERIDTLGFLAIGHGQGLAGWTSQANRPVLLSDRSGTIGFNPERDFGTFASLPLPSTLGALGALNLGWRKAQACDEPTFELLLVLADQVGLIVECSLCRQRQSSVQVRMAQVLRDREAQIPSEEFGRRLVTAREYASTLKFQINDPLSIIVGNAQCLLAEESILSQKHVSRLRRIEEAALRISSLNEQLRELDGLLAEPPPTHNNRSDHQRRPAGSTTKR
jgi:signal transduction histidine kinase